MLVLMHERRFIIAQLVLVVMGGFMSGKGRLSRCFKIVRRDCMRLGMRQVLWMGQVHQ